MQATSLLAQIVVLGCKASIAVLLLVAGGAKLADLSGFAGTVREFLPGRAPARLSGCVAAAVAVAEVGVGAASLSMPLAGWLNPAVLALCCGFLAVWTAGFLRHRGRPCRCFGALSRRGFTAAGILRAAGLALAAQVGAIPVPSPAVRIGLVPGLLLAAGSGLVAAAAFSAAMAASPGRGSPVPARWS